VKKIIRKTISILVFPLSILYGLALLFQFLFFIHPFGDTLAAISLFNWVVSLAVAILFLILSVLLYRNFITLEKLSAFRNSRYLIYLGSFFLVFSLYEFINTYFKSGLDLTPFSFVDPVSIIGSLSVIAGFLGINVDEAEKEESYQREKNKFFKRFKVLSFLILLFLIIYIIFNVCTYKGIGYQGDIGNLELNGRVVFQETSSRNGIYRQCMIDLSNPKEIDCFDENGRVPFWGPDGKNIFYYKWDEEGHIDTVIYNTIDGTKEMLSGEDEYEENRKLRESERIENPLNHYLKAAVSPDGKRTVYVFAGTVYLLDHYGEQTVLIKSERPSSKGSCGAATWYSNEKILLACALKSNDAFAKEKYQRGFFLIDADGSNLTLIVSNDGPDWLYYEYPDLYR